MTNVTQTSTSVFVTIKDVRNSVSIHREITRVIVFPDTRRMTTGKPAAVTFIHVGLLLLCLYIHTDRALTGAVIAFYIVSHADAFYILNCRLITRRFRFASSHISTLITWKHDTLNHLHSHHLSLPLHFTPDLKLISFTNPFLHSHSYSFRTDFTDLNLY